LATAWLLLRFKRHLTTGAELVVVAPSVRANAARADRTSDDSDESASPLVARHGLGARWM
jgi:hypothetical protein